MDLNDNVDFKFKINTINCESYREMYFIFQGIYNTSGYTELDMLEVIIRLIYKIRKA